MTLLALWNDAANNAEMTPDGASIANTWHYFKPIVQGVILGWAIYGVLRVANIFGTHDDILRDGINTASYKFGPCDDTGRDLVLESHLFS
jgi:hypothetical protein